MAIQRVALSNVPHMDGGGDWKPQVDGNGRVTRIDATGLKLAAGVAKVPSGSGFNPVQVPGNPPSWATLENLQLTHQVGPPNYMRMHMLNARLGGPGDTPSNLTPGTASLNWHHSWHFEQPAIEVLNAGLTLDQYWVSVQYNAPSAVLTSPVARQAWENTVWRIQGGFTYTDALGAQQTPGFDADEDVPLLDTKPNWLGN